MHVNAKDHANGKDQSMQITRRLCARQGETSTMVKKAESHARRTASVMCPSGSATRPPTVEPAQLGLPALSVPLVTAGPATSGLSTWPGDQADGGD